MRKAGFTLLEMSIVLAIIGLLIGGVMAGKSLLDAANLRAGISQIEEFKLAAQAFELKYNGVPGDIFPATKFGFGHRWGGEPGLGNNNGRIENRYVSGDSTNTWGEEIIYFWNDLTRAGLINEGLDPAIDYISWSCSSDACHPRSKVTDKQIHILLRDGVNHFFLMSQPGWLSVTPTLTPNQAFNWDSKMDDGNPLTGQVNARGGSWQASIITPSPTGCANTTTTYNTTSAHGDSVLCAISIRMGIN